MIYARDKKWPDAELHFGKAINLRPNAYWILQAFGAAKLAAGRVAEAEELLKQAEDANPNSPAVLIEMGRLREKLNDFPSAEYYYRRAIEQDRDNSLAYYTLARLLYRGGDVNQAYEYATYALASRPLDQHNKALVKELKEKVAKSQDTDKRVISG